MPRSDQGDITIWQGADGPYVQWQFFKNDIPDDQNPINDDLFDLTGSVLYLTIGRVGEVIISKNTTDNASAFSFDVSTAVLTWKPTLAETRLLGRGRVMKYEVERRIGGVQEGPFAHGYVEVDGGLNLD